MYWGLHFNWHATLVYQENSLMMMMMMHWGIKKSVGFFLDTIKNWKLCAFVGYTYAVTICKMQGTHRFKPVDQFETLLWHQNSLSPGEDLNQKPSEYKAGVLTTRPRRRYGLWYYRLWHRIVWWVVNNVSKNASVTIFSIQGDVVCLSETSASSPRALHPLPSSEFPFRWCACRSSAWHTVLPEKLPHGQGCWLSVWRSAPLVVRCRWQGGTSERGFTIRFPARAGTFLFTAASRPAVGASLASCSVGTAVRSPEVNCGVQLTTCLRLVPSWRMGGAVPSLTRRHNMVSQ